MFCEQAAVKELIDYAETEEERNALKQQHRALLLQMVQMEDLDMGPAAPIVGEAKPTPETLPTQVLQYSLRNQCQNLPSNECSVDPPMWNSSPRLANVFPEATRRMPAPIMRHRGIFLSSW